jgi:bidirectional [NiFe] hydrogenase diaphorase subunit
MDHLNDLREVAAEERAACKAVRVRVCMGTNCLFSRAEAVKQGLDSALAGANLRGRVQVCGVGCLRLCSHGPLVGLVVSSKAHRQFWREATG